MVVSSFPITASAGIFNFVTELFADEMEVQAEQHNIQNMPILEAVQNINPNRVNNIPDLVMGNDGVVEANVGPLGTPLEIVEQNLPDKVIVYTVRQGDTVASLAKMFEVSQNTIIWANDGNRTLKLGSEVIILPVNGIRYVVKFGDTIAGIAKKFKADADEIIRFNDLGDKLVSGTEIIIPDGEITTVSSKSGSKQAVTVPAGASGYFIKPTSGRISQGPHGPRRTGVDIANKIGTPVYAAASGKVIVARLGGYNGGYGNYIVIEHNNGMQTLYAHLSAVSVSSGQIVKQGDYIGAIGNTGKSTGSHLHFQVNGGTWGWNPVSK